MTSMHKLFNPSILQSFNSSILQPFSLSILFLLAFTLTACEENDDFSTVDDGDYTGLKSIETITAHSKGKGFPIVIMGDGFSAADISNGTYTSAVQKTVNALFASEPMASLREYCDVYNVTVVSDVSGITTVKRATAFGTRLKSTDGVDVYGDSIKVQEFAAKALDKAGMKLSNAQVIVLLNSKQYAGVTLMTEPPTVTDSVPRGYSLSYVPMICMHEGDDYFDKVLQHEAIGHGIGKLHDEYFQNYDAPTQQFIDHVKNYQRQGYFLNTHYDAETENTSYDTEYVKLYQNGKYYALLSGIHEIEAGCFGYLFAQDPAYDSEELKWYQGGATYLTLGEEYTGTQFTKWSFYSGMGTMSFTIHNAAKNFYRPTRSSLMNDVFRNGSQNFNAMSRYVIYARVMKVANGGTSENLRSESLHTQFMEFDKLRGASSGAQAKGLGMASSDAVQKSLPHLPAPRIIKLKE